MALDADQRAALLAAKARALVAASFDLDDDVRPVGFAGGAALHHADTAWVLLDERPAWSLGRALAWALQREAATIHVIADVDADVLARRAALFALDVRVWSVQGRELHAAQPAPAPAESSVTDRELEVAAQLVDAGAEVVVEGGAVRGEIEGLEVARVVRTGDDVRLEVGVGRHDREAFAVLHGDLPTTDALATVVAAVRQHRRPGRPAHPLNRLAGERWLRRRLVAEPGLVGAAHLEPVEGTLVRDSVKDVAAAMAVGATEAGEPLVVACSTGIDLDLVPAAADARAARRPDARLLLAVPERDAHPVTRRLAEHLRQPAAVVALPADRP